MTPFQDHDGPASLTDSLRDGWGDDAFYGEPEHAQANYTLAVVYPDGNPVDMRSFGTDKALALELLREVRERSNPHREHWMVYDADDPERGYFDPEPTDCTGGVAVAASDRSDIVGHSSPALAESLVQPPDLAVWRGERNPDPDEPF